MLTVSFGFAKFMNVLLPWPVAYDWSHQLKPFTRVLVYWHTALLMSRIIHQMFPQCRSSIKSVTLTRSRSLVSIFSGASSGYLYLLWGLFSIRRCYATDWQDMNCHRLCCLVGKWSFFRTYCSDLVKNIILTFTFLIVFLPKVTIFLVSWRY